LVSELILKNYIHAALSTISWYVPVGAREAIALSFTDLKAIPMKNCFLTFFELISVS
jgi:hypothetical protein